MPLPPRSARAAAGRATPADARSACLRRVLQVPGSGSSGRSREPARTEVSAPVASVGWACEKVGGNGGSAGAAASLMGGAGFITGGGTGSVGGGDGAGSDGGAARCDLRASSSCTSSSSCSRNCRAMARARPTQRPTSETTRGSFSGPSTISARTKMIRISKNRPSNRSGAPVVLGVALRRDFRELRVPVFGTDLLGRGGLLVLAVAHRFLESTHGMPEVRAHGAQFLGTEHDEHDEQDDHQLAHSYTHSSLHLKSPRGGGEDPRIIGQMSPWNPRSSTEFEGPSRSARGGLEPECHRALVGERHLHIRAKYAC